jgi:hypothetical protein
VFTNRLRIGMPLQTDPTVIYGMGAAFDGNLRKKDLQADTPWNTYTRGGLPPTPIAMPGKASLLAAVQPAQSKSLYFVARATAPASSASSLDDHNRAVNKYQRGATPNPRRPNERTGLFLTLRRHRRRRQVDPHRGAGRAVPRAGPHRALTREPGGTPLAETLRGLILNSRWTR